MNKQLQSALKIMPGLRNREIFTQRPYQESRESRRAKRRASRGKVVSNPEYALPIEQFIESKPAYSTQTDSMNYTSSTESNSIGATVNYDGSNYEMPASASPNAKSLDIDPEAIARELMEEGVKPTKGAVTSALRKKGVIGKAFTLIELLVVVGTISILASMLLPVLGKAREKAKRVICAGQIDQLNKGNIMYSSDNDSSVFRFSSSDYSAIPRAHISSSAYGPEGLAILQQQNAFGTDINGFKKLVTCPSEERNDTGATAASLNNYPTGNAVSSRLLMNLPTVMLNAEYDGNRASDDAKSRLLRDDRCVDKKYFAIISCQNDANVWCHKRRGLNAARIDGSVHWIGEPNLCDAFADRNIVVDEINKRLY